MKVSADGFSRGKGLLRPLRGVTVKMETPVIYFYSDEPFKGSVEVGFKGGSISQWYPGRQGGEEVAALPRPYVGADGELVMPPKDAGLIDFSDGKYGGKIKWDFEVLAPDAANAGKVFRPGETLNWLRPRQTASNVVKIGAEHEKYLFYRGLGNFKMPIEFRVDSAEILRITNGATEAVPYALVFEMNDSFEIGLHELKGGLKAGETAEISREELFPPKAPGVVPLWMDFTSVGPHYEKMVSGLMGAGLRRDEADAMVQTWWDSYFQRPGLRVFWVVPRGETDRVLPLKVSPEPKEMVRVLVGRSEILRPEFEQKLVAESRDEKVEEWDRRKADRFGEAYEVRVKALTEATSVTAVTE
jgi:hypothetical protein